MLAAPAGNGVTPTTTGHKLAASAEQVQDPGAVLEQPAVREAAQESSPVRTPDGGSSCLTGRPGGQNPDEASDGVGGQPWTTTAAAC